MIKSSVCSHDMGITWARRGQVQLKLINFESSGGLVPQAPGPQILAYDHQAILISAYDLKKKIMKLWHQTYLRW